MASELNAFISRLMYKFKLPTSPLRTGWSLYFLLLLSEFHSLGVEPTDKKLLICPTHKIIPLAWYC